MDPNSPSLPQPVQTTQPMTHPGLPPESTSFASSSPPKKGSKLWLVIVVIVVLLALIGGGIYAFTIINGIKTENAKHANIVMSPSSVLSSPIPATSSAVATSSATVDPADPNLMDYDSPCVSFKYPNNWVKVNENMLLNHYKSASLDPYGSTQFNLFRKYTNQTMKTNPNLILVNCGPSTEKFDFQSIKEHLNNSSSGSRPPDSISETTISGLQAARIFYKPNKTKEYIQFGNIEIETIKNNTFFDIQLRWDYPEQSDPNLPGQKEFQSIVDSVQLKDYFK